MSNQFYTEPAGILVKTTLVDFPGRVAGSFFLRGCNLRCPYCYNKVLIHDSSEPEDFSSLSDLFSHLEKRRNLISGVVISGGEPTINPNTKEIITKAKELGYKVKLDTNGLLPKKLEEFLSDPVLCPDFIALDIKTSPERYSECLTEAKSSALEIKNYYASVIKESAAIVSKLNKDKREFRTVLVPNLVTKKDIFEISRILPEDASWQFAQFQNKNCLDPSYDDLLPYSDDELNQLIEYAKTLIPGAQLR